MSYCPKGYWVKPGSVKIAEAYNIAYKMCVLPVYDNVQEKNTGHLISYVGVVQDLKLFDFNRMR